MMNIFLAILPTIILGKYIYNRDEIEKEPHSLLVLLFIAGILSALTTVIITLLISFIPFFDYDELSMTGIILFIKVFFGIGLIEEFSKWIYIYLIGYKNKAFNYLYDAIVYSVFVSLGFATVENILYVAEYGRTVALYRMVLSVPGHAFFGVMMGYYLGLSKLSKIHNKHDKSTIYLLMSVFVPALIHSMFDYLIMDDYMLIYYIFVIGLYIFALTKVRRISKINVDLFGNDNNVYGKFGTSIVQKPIVNVQPEIITSTVNVVPEYCDNCGTKLSGPFCTNCGKKMY